MNKQTIMAENAPAAVGPYVHAVKVGNLVFASGQLGLDPVIPATGEIAEGGVEAQAEQSLKNIGAVLKAAGCSYEDVVKTTIFLADINDFAAINAIYSKYFTGSDTPARSCVQAGAIPKGGLFEMEVIAVTKD